MKNCATQEEKNQSLVALRRVQSEIIEKAREQVSPGVHEGSAIVRLTYSIKVGKDSEREVAAAVPWQRMALFLLSKVNPATRDTWVREAVEAIQQDQDEGALFEELKAEATAAVRKVMKATKRTTKGAVTGTCDVEFLT